MGTYFLIAVRNLLQARRRSLLLGLAFAIVTLLVVLLLALSEGVTQNMIKSATTLTTGHVNVAGFYKANAADAAPVVVNAAEIRKIVQENTPDLAYILDRGRGWAKAISETGSQFAGVTGIDPKDETHLAQTLVLAYEDSYIDKEKGGLHERKGDLTRLGEDNTAVIFVSQAKKLGVRVGDVITLTAQSGRGVNNSADVTVVAVCEDLGLLSSISFFTSKKTGNALYQLKDDTAGAVHIYLKDMNKSAEVMEHLRQVFEQKGYKLLDHEANPFWMKFPQIQGADWLGQKLDITMWSDEVSFLAKVVTGINWLIVVLTTFLLLIIAVGIMNTMWMAIRERTGEIGTLRAVGMQRSNVALMILIEAMVLAFAATAAGALLAVSIAWALDWAQLTIASDAIRFILISNKLHMVIVPWQVIASVVSFTLVAGLAALFPAIRAARMQPVTAIQQVE
jgi:putative ABC transport system permease protein